MFTLAWLKGAAERGLKTFAQSLLGGFVVTAPIVEQPWLVALGVAGSALVVSLLTSVVSADFVAGDSSAPED